MAGAQVLSQSNPGRLIPGERGVLQAVGDWTTSCLGDVERALAAMPAPTSPPTTLDLSGLSRLDTNGVVLMRRALARAGAGPGIAMVGARPEHGQLIEVVSGAERPPPEKADRSSAIGKVFDHVGRVAVRVAGEAVELLSFVGAAVVTVGRLTLRPWRIRWRALATQIETTGLHALPIVGLLNFLIGVVIAYQAATQLSKFGAQLLTVDSVGVGVLRELGVLITAIIVAGRSGSAFTAQIGSMRVNQEIDAMQAIGLNPLEILCAPRIMALMLVLPLLVFYADVMGILGGAVAAMFALDITMNQFAHQLQAAVSIDHFWVGIVKAPVMAAIIAMVGCFHGLKVSSNAESVGRRTTQSVVQSIFYVIAIDALFSIFFLIIGI